jgi:hypothetical protein
MYVCMYVCMYGCVCVCVCVCLYLYGDTTVYRTGTGFHERKLIKKNICYETSSEVNQLFTIMTFDLDLSKDSYFRHF